MSERLPRGVCYACGMNSLAFRLDKKGRPFLVCEVCHTKVFARCDGGAARWLARSLQDVGHGSDWVPRFREAYHQLVSVLRERGYSVPEEQPGQLRQGMPTREVEV